MSGICGWINKDAELSGTDTIQKMLEPINSLKNPTQQTHTSYSSAAISPLNNDADILHEGSLIIAYIGRASWSVADFQKIMTEESMAKAIFKAYQSLGKTLLNKLKGPFSLAIIDTRQNTALIAIDRIGIYPLCFSAHSGGFVFGSTATSVTAHPLIPTSINPQGIFNYLYFHMVPSPGSIFNGVEKLLPGQYAYFENAEITKDFYWHLEYEDNNTKTEEDLSNQCMQTLRETMTRHVCTSDVGAFLSGGTDSSTMTGLLSEYLGEGAETFSIGFDAEGFDETEYAKIAVNHFKTSHHEYRVTSTDVADAIPLIARTYDEPFGNASAVPTYFCAKMAKEHGVNVLIAGDGGDEIFAGNERYTKQQVFEHYYKLPSLLRAKFIEPIALNFPGMSRITPTRKLQSYIQQASVPLPDRLESYNFLNRTGLTEIFSADFINTINPEEPLSICRNAYDSTHSKSIINKMMHLDLKNTLADNDLRKVNKMCEAAGIDVRYPLLDEKLVKFAAQVPPSLHLKDGKLRYFYKYALKDFLPKEILTKSKHGFGLPFGLWLKENPRLQEISQNNLAALVKRGIINQSYINELHRLHQSEHASYYGVMVWVLTMLEQWLIEHKISI